MRQAATLIHVNRHNIRSNKVNGTNKPVFTVKQSGKKNRYGHSVKVDGPVEFVYRPCSPLSCGAVAWVKTYANVVVS